MMYWAVRTGPVVVCLKHVGITDGVRERLKTSVNTLASWSGHALSTHPGNLSVNVNLFKGLTHYLLGYGGRDHTVVRNSLCSNAWFSVACLEASIKGI